MELRPGSKQTEVGVIPEEWNVDCLGSIATLERGKFTARPRNDPRFYGGDVPFIQTGDVTNSNGCIEAYSQSLNPQGLKVSRLFPRGTLFFTIAANIGDVAFASFDTACPDSLIGITPSARVDRRWLFHALKIRKTAFEALATQNAQLNISLEKLRPYSIPIPPLSEQRAIAEALDDADALIDALDQLIAKKRNLRQAAMQQLLTGQTRLPGFTGEWEVRRLGELFSFSGGLSASREQLSDSGLCYLHYGDIHRSTKSFININVEFIDIPKLDVALSEVSASARLQDGDVVFVDASEDDEGTSRHLVIMNPGHTPYISGLHTIVAKSRSGALDNGYKRYCFQSQNMKEQFRFYAAGTKVSGISKTSIVKIVLTYPPSVPEQTAIAAVLSDMDADIAALEQRLAKTRALKQGMMQELLTGRTRLV